jgi:PAS domain S-box-containing protein
MTNNSSNRSQENKNVTAVGGKEKIYFAEGLIEDKMFLLASVVESSDDAIITKTLEGTITFWNSGAERIYGFSGDEVVGKPISILIPPGHTDEVPEILERISRGESIHHYETVRMRKDGNIIHVFVSISPVKDKDGRIVGASTIARDITEEVRARKQYDERLTSIVSEYKSKKPPVGRKDKNIAAVGSEERIYFAEGLIEDKMFLLASIVESSDDAIITKTSKGIITSWNSGAERIYGFSGSEVVGKPISILIPPGHTDEVPGILERISRGESIHHYETVRMRKDGYVIHVSVSISPVKDRQGRIVGASTIARDITAEVKARKQSEEKLAAASQYTRSLIEASLDPLVTISGDGKITDVNEATIRVTGIPREELIGTDFSNYFTEPEKAREGYQKVFAKGFVTDYPLTIRHRDGQLTDVLYNASVYRDTRGNVLGVFAAARDVTSQKQAAQYARSLIEASLDPLVTISGDGKITDVNEATIRVTGVPREELIGTDFSNYFIEPEKAREGYQQVFAKGFVTDYPLTIRHRDSRLTDVLYNASVYKDSRGNVLGVFAAARDVTARKRVEEELAEQRKRELDRLAELEKFQKLTVGRELKMVELKREINDLKMENEELKRKFNWES